MSEGERALIGAGVDPAGLRSLLAQDCDWYWETDTELRLTVARAAGADRPAIGHERWPGRRLWDLFPDVVPPATWEAARRAMEGQQSLAGVAVRASDAQRRVVTLWHCGAPVFRGDGSFSGFVGIARDISEQVQAQETLQRLASVDPLTRLLNREAFDEQAQQALAGAYARGEPCALLCIALDRFHALNSVYGHRIGDRMLAVVADRLGRVVRAPHLLGRRGGEEIIALLVGLESADAQAVARTVVDTIAPSERLGQVEVSVRGSVGVAHFPKDGGDLDELLNAADAALFSAKEAGGGRQAPYTEELARRTDLRVRLEQRLRRAYGSRDFRLFYQPLVSLSDGGRLVGAEALLRWKDAELGDIEPGEFIPIAEESGLIDGVGDWVLREACRQRQLWRQAGLDLPPIAVNVSGVQMRREDFTGYVLATLDEFDVAAEELEIEITETGLMDAPATSRESLARLQDAGVKAALDDFGVGYSSLAHLRDLPMHRLKIDRSFTNECMHDARTLTIVKSVIDMAHNLGLVVTAEGIETAEQRDWMRQLGCDSGQGYLFARPMPAEEFLSRFLDGRRMEGARVA